jgi:predicted  nucleic acid-binding Zn-ribbon protein
MAMGSRGREGDTATDPGPDPMANMLQVLGDPDVLAARIRSLHEAMAESVKALDDVRAAHANLDARAIELDEREVSLETQASALNERVKDLDEHERALEEEAAKATVKATSVTEALEVITKKQEATADIEAALAKREKELEAKEAAVIDHMSRLEQVKDKLAQFEKQLFERQADIERRFEAMKALVN